MQNSMNSMSRFQEAYFKWASMRHLVENATKAREIPSEHWRTRQNAWDEYCIARDEAMPKRDEKDERVVRKIYRTKSRADRGEG